MENNTTPYIDELIDEAQRLMDMQKQIDEAKKQIRAMIEVDGLERVLGDWNALLELLDVNYSRVIDGATDQKSYDKICLDVFTTSQTALEIAKDIRNSKVILNKHIGLVKSFAMCTCPYCGSKFKESYADDLEEELKNYERLEWFYLEYYRRRIPDRKRLYQIAAEKKLDVSHWQKVYNINSKGGNSNGNED